MHDGSRLQSHSAWNFVHQHSDTQHYHGFMEIQIIIYKMKLNTDRTADTYYRQFLNPKLPFIPKTLVEITPNNMYICGCND